VREFIDHGILIALHCSVRTTTAFLNVGLVVRLQQKLLLLPSTAWPHTANPGKEDGHQMLWPRH